MRVEMRVEMKKINRFLFMNLGCILLAMGVYFFKIPNGFATGGVSGVSTIFAKRECEKKSVKLIPSMIE